MRLASRHPPAVGGHTRRCRPCQRGRSPRSRALRYRATCQRTRSGPGRPACGFGARAKRRPPRVRRGQSAHRAAAGCARDFRVVADTEGGQALAARQIGQVIEDDDKIARRVAGER